MTYNRFNATFQFDLIFFDAMLLFSLYLFILFVYVKVKCRLNRLINIKSLNRSTSTLNLSQDEKRRKSEAIKRDR